MKDNRCKISAVFTIDFYYIKHFTTACCSLLEHNASLIDHIYLIIDEEVSKRKLFDEALGFLRDHYRVEYSIISINSFDYSNLKISKHVTQSTYYRLSLAKILPQNLDKILFLDSDIIVNNSIEELTKLDFDSNCYLYAVNHNYRRNELARLSFAGFNSPKYFNAGVMVIDLKKWREENVSEKLIEIAMKFNNKLLFWDQDVLNIYFEGRWKEVDYRYNAFALEEQSNPIPKDLVIVHYTGSSKPWHLINEHPLKHMYWKYRKKTPFYPGLYEDINIKNLIYFITPMKYRNLFKSIKNRLLH